MKQVKVAALVISCLLLSACPAKLASTARDTEAALSAALVAAQDKYLVSCQANSAQTACQAINKAGAAQNALITATETYCGWTVQPITTVPTASCVPVSSAAAALQAAISNATAEISEIKGVLQ